MPIKTHYLFVSVRERVLLSAVISCPRKVTFSETNYSFDKLAL